MNKKGAIVEDLTDFLFLVFAAFFSLVFIGLALGQVEDQNFLGVWDNVQEQESHYLILNYLESSVNVSGETMSMYDLLKLWDSNKAEYKSVMEKESIRILDSFSYEFEHPTTDNIRIKSFSLLAYPGNPVVWVKGAKSKMNQTITSGKKFDIDSSKWKDGFCEPKLCPFRGNVFVDLPSGKTYLFLLTSVAARSTYE